MCVVVEHCATVYIPARMFWLHSALMPPPTIPRLHAHKVATVQRSLQQRDRQVWKRFRQMHVLSDGAGSSICSRPTHIHMCQDNGRLKQVYEVTNNRTLQMQPDSGCTKPRRSPLLVHQKDPSATQLCVVAVPDLLHTAAWCASAASAGHTHGVSIPTFRTGEMDEQQPLHLPNCTQHGSRGKV